jgi:WD40 repeat protein/serine/threonine protein kinase
MTGPSSGRDRLQELAEEFADRYRRGEHPSVTEYTDKYPDLAERIRALFPTLVAPEQPASVAGPPTGPFEPKAGQGSEPPQQLGDYRILREVGRGGMGIVYEAVQVSLGRHVALKVLPPHVLLERHYLLRFQREAKAAARLHHTNIVPVYGVGEENGLHYYVMQFIQGLALDKVLAELRRLRRPKGRLAANEATRDTCVEAVKAGAAAAEAQSLLLGHFSLGPASAEHQPSDVALHQGADTHRSPGADITPSDTSIRLLSQPASFYWQSVARVGVQVAEALGYANSQGILHRDIKPSNLLLDPHGTVWVTDFGLAKAADSEDLTHPGDIVGTVRYLAPERFGGRCDVRSDLYALGLTLYELLTLEPAFPEADRTKLLHQVMHEEPARPRKLNPHVPHDLETIVLKSIARDPNQRYPTADELAADLKRFLRDEPIRARRVSAGERAWRWCFRNPALASLMAAVLLLLVGMTVVETVSAVRIAAARDEALKAAEESRQRLVHAQVAAGAGRVEQGDLFSALPWFADALRLDQGDPAREENHRLRLAAILQRSPRLIAFWSTEPGPDQAVFCPDGRRVIVWGPHGLQIWDTAADRLAAVVVKDAALTDLAFSPNGKMVGMAGENGTARIWNLETGQPVTPPLSHGKAVNRVEFRADGRQLVTASDDGTARVWDAVTGEQLHCFTHSDAVRCASFSPDGNRVVTLSGDHTIRVWIVASDTSKPFSAGIAVGNREVVFSADGRRIVVTAREPLVRTWDAETFALRSSTLSGGRAWLSPDRSRAVSADLAVRVWDVSTGQPVTPPLEQARGAFKATFSPQGDRLVTTGVDGTVWVCATETGATVAGPLRHAASVTSAAFSPDGRLLLTRESTGLVRVWDLAGSALPSSPVAPSFGAGPFPWLSPDGRWEVTAVHGTALWNTRTGRRPKTVFHDAIFGVAVVSPDASRFATGHTNGVARLWETATGLPIGRPLEHEGNLAVLGASTVALLGSTPGPGPFLAGSAVYGETSRDWWVCHVAFSPDGRLLATTGQDKTARVWNAATGEPLARMPHEHAVRWAAFSPTSRLLVTASGDFSTDWDGFYHPGSNPARSGEAQVWVAATGRPITPPMHHEGVVVRAAFSPDGRYILTTCVSRAADRYQVQVWNAATGQPVTRPLVHPQTVLHETFSPDGRWVATSCADGAARVWPLVGQAFEPDLPDSQAWRPCLAGGIQSRFPAFAHRQRRPHRADLGRHDRAANCFAAARERGAACVLRSGRLFRDHGRPGWPGARLAACARPPPDRRLGRPGRGTCRRRRRRKQGFRRGRRTGFGLADPACEIPERLRYDPSGTTRLAPGGAGDRFREENLAGCLGAPDSVVGDRPSRLAEPAGTGPHAGPSRALG